MSSHVYLSPVHIAYFKSPTIQMHSLWLKKSRVGEFERLIMITERNAELIIILQHSLLLHVLHELLFK